MSIIARYTQTPAEVKKYKLDYTDWLDTGELLASANTTIDVTTAPVLLAVAALTSGSTFVTVTVSGGTSDTTYIVKVTITTDGGQTKEDCIEISLETACT